MIMKNSIKKALADIEKGASITSTALKYKISRSSLQIIARKNGIRSDYQKKVENPNKEKIKTDVLNMRRSGMSLSAIAKKIGYCHSTVSDWCEKENIQLTPEQLKKIFRAQKSQIKKKRLRIEKKVCM